MKLFHISDLHLGKRVNEFSMLEDQDYILKQIIDIAKIEKPEAVIIAGDIYDKSVPTAEAVSLLDEFLTFLVALGIKVFVISGNHDSAERLAFGARLMQGGGVYFSPIYNGDIEPIIAMDEFGEVNFYLVPFLKPANVRRFFPDEEMKNTNEALEKVINSLNVDQNKRNVLVAHQFVKGTSLCDSEELSIGGTEEVDAALFSHFDYVALGHIHGPQRAGGDNIRYCGTPLKYSFSEAKHKKSLTVLELGTKGQMAISEIPLKPLRDMREIKGSYNEIMDKENALNDNKDDYLHVILTDEEDILDAVKKLHIVYPNIMKLSYDNIRTRTAKEEDVKEAEVEKTPQELFGEFYKRQNGTELNQKQQEFCDNIIEKLLSR